MDGKLATVLSIEGRALDVVASAPQTITPDEARELLATQVQNRPMSKAVISQYARDMRNGHWRLTGAPIAFDWHGHLIDGQQRLQAVIVADTPTQFFVATGLDPASQNNIDRGRKRTLANQFAIFGEKDTLRLAAIVNGVWQFRNGTTGTYDLPTFEEAYELFQSDPEGFRAATKATSLFNKSILTSKAKTVGVAMYLFTAIDSEDTFDFFNKLREGLFTEKTDPLYKLNEALKSEALASTRHTDKYMLAIFIKAWNAYRSQTHIKVLTLKGRERFPEPL